MAERRRGGENIRFETRDCLRFLHTKQTFILSQNSAITTPPSAPLLVDGNCHSADLNTTYAHPRLVNIAKKNAS